MQRNTRPLISARSGSIRLILMCAACLPGAAAADYRFGYSNSFYYPYGAYGAHDSLRFQRQIDHLNDQMQRQQRTLDEQSRRQQQQTQLLRQQQSAQQQFTARQACHYRLDGGLELCDRLFGSASKTHAECVETAKEMNFGCVADTEVPVTRSGD